MPEDEINRLAAQSGITVTNTDCSDFEVSIYPLAARDVNKAQTLRCDFLLRLATCPIDNKLCRLLVATRCPIICSKGDSTLTSLTINVLLTLFNVDRKKVQESPLLLDSKKGITERVCPHN